MLPFERATRYGFGCYAHDFNGSSGSPQCAAGNPADWCEVCSSSNPADWCDDQWCYVDEKNCSITHEETQPLGRFWSYTTCGYRDLFSLENITESIRGKTLRVLYISNTGGWKGNYCTGVKGQPCVPCTQNICGTCHHSFTGCMPEAKFF